MKTRILTLALLLPFNSFWGQSLEQEFTDQGPVTYLLRKVLLSNKDSGALVLLPLCVENIKHFEPKQEVKYWSIMEKYFPGISRDSLQKMVAAGTWVNESIRLNGFTFFFPKVPDNASPDLAALYKQYHYIPIYAISRIVYSKDGNTCIVYINGYQEGPFTVEIKKDASGKWASHTSTTDWLI